MNVLSLFDGMSGARLALDKAGIKVDKYFASEVDKYAIKVSQAKITFIPTQKEYDNIMNAFEVKIDVKHFKLED